MSTFGDAGARAEPDQAGSASKRTQWLNLHDRPESVVQFFPKGHCQLGSSVVDYGASYWQMTCMTACDIYAGSGKEGNHNERS